MKRVFAVLLIAALTTLSLGIDQAVSASQSGDQRKAEKQRADVMKALRGMQSGSTAAVELKNGMKFDVVIQDITADDVTVLRQVGDKTVSEVIPIGDLARIKNKSLKSMGLASKILIVTAASLGVLFVAALAACSVSTPNAPALSSAQSAGRS